MAIWIFKKGGGEVEKWSSEVVRHIRTIQSSSHSHNKNLSSSELNSSCRLHSNNESTEKKDQLGTFELFRNPHTPRIQAARSCTQKTWGIQWVPSECAIQDKYRATIIWFLGLLEYSTMAEQSICLCISRCCPLWLSILWFDWDGKARTQLPSEVSP